MGWAPMTPTNSIIETLGIGPAVGPGFTLVVNGPQDFPTHS